MTRSSRGVRFEVKEVLTPFGEGFEERVAKAEAKTQGGEQGMEVEGEAVQGRQGELLGGLDGTTVAGGERMSWWKRREMRGISGRRGRWARNETGASLRKRAEANVEGS